MMRKLTISEEKQQLEGLARISRSVVPFEKSLEEKCMECILKNAPLLHAHSATRDQFARIPPLVRRDFLKMLRTWFEASREYHYQNWINEDLKRILYLLRLLLDESVTEFDFGIFSDRYTQDEQTWRLLLERCPNLSSVEDGRYPMERAGVQIEDFLPRLLRLSHLEHIQIKTYWGWEEGELARLFKAFPDLRSLAVCFKHHQAYSFLRNLCSLRKLETLWLAPQHEFTDEDDESEMFLAWEWKQELMAECLLHLPALQEVDIFWHHVLDHVLHNEGLANPSVLKKPLALRTVRARKSLNGWTCDKLPHVTKLLLKGPLRDVKEFLGFTNLTVLHLSRLSAADDAMMILRSCGCKLQELRVNLSDAVRIDLHELFFACPNLKNLNLNGCQNHEGDPELHPVTADNLKRLERVNISNLSGGPSKLLVKLFEVPRLRIIHLSRVELDMDLIKELSSRLQRKEILQHLRQFGVRLYDVEQRGREHFVTFLKTLVAFAPRLLSCSDCSYSTTRDADSSELFKHLQIRGLQPSILVWPRGNP